MNERCKLSLIGNELPPGVRKMADKRSKARPKLAEEREEISLELVNWNFNLRFLTFKIVEIEGIK